MSEIPFGYCQCGCGGKTRVPTVNRYTVGEIKGRPLRFLRGHNSRKEPSYTVDPTTGCWNWDGLTRYRGYGVLRERMAPGEGKGRNVCAHRWFYEQRFGPIPKGLELDHLCRNPACVNPDHLEPVTHAENVRRGALTKLTADEVREIRASSESASELGRRLGVTATRINQIRRGEGWKDVAAA